MIKAEGLTKHYGPLTAVDQISFKVEPGEVLGFLGPNGAGKTTTMRMFAGFVPPSAGTAEICGHSIIDQPLEAKSRLGYLPEGAPSYPEMTPLGFLEFVGRVRGMSAAELTQRLEEVVALLHLESVIGQPIETLSKGFKRRVGLAQAILHDPEVLILDEPTSGLDVESRQQVWELIRSLKDGRSIIMSTQHIEEADELADRVCIMSHGKVIALGTPDNIKRRFGVGYNVYVEARYS